MKINKKQVKNIVGIDLTDEEIVLNLKKMGLLSKKVENNFEVEIPFYRTDILH